MRKCLVFCLLPLFVILSSCTGRFPPSIPGSPANRAEYAAPTHTPRLIPTPLAKGQSGEITLLLRKHVALYEVMILRLPTTCLLEGEICDVNGNILGELPQSLSQTLKIYWTNNGDKAFFWDDNTTNIYTLDGNQGTFEVFQKEVLKVKHSFLFSPDEKNIIFEIQKGDYETDLVMMNSLSGEIFNFNVPMPGAKYVSQWIDDQTVLFWNEISAGKGNLVGWNVYTLNTVNHIVQPFDIGRNWMHTSVPIFSPDKKLMVFTDGRETIIRNASTALESVWDVHGEQFLWSMNSSLLAIYDSNRKIYALLPNAGDLQEIYSLSEIGVLEDWMWLSDNEHILLIVVDSNGNRQLGVLSVMEKTLTPIIINLSLLSEYDPVSFSFRP